MDNGTPRRKYMAVFGRNVGSEANARQFLGDVNILALEGYAPLGPPVVVAADLIMQAMIWTAACSLCGKPWPHEHSLEEIAAWKEWGGLMGDSSPSTEEMAAQIADPVLREMFRREDAACLTQRKEG